MKTAQDQEPKWSNVKNFNRTAWSDVVNLPRGLFTIISLLVIHCKLYIRFGWENSHCKRLRSQHYSGNQWAFYRNCTSHSSPFLSTLLARIPIVLSAPSIPKSHPKSRARTVIIVKTLRTKKPKLEAWKEAPIQGVCYLCIDRRGHAMHLASLWHILAVVRSPIFEASSSHIVLDRVYFDIYENVAIFFYFIRYSNRTFFASFNMYSNI